MHRKTNDTTITEATIATITEATIATLRAATMALAALAFAATAHAQRTPARRVTPAAQNRTGGGHDRLQGFMLGVHTIAAPGVSITGEDIDGSFATTFGAGAGLMIGYGFNRTFSAYASLDLAKQRTRAGDEPEGTFGLAHYEVGARANLPLGNLTTVPYVNASLGRRALGARVTDLETDEQFDMTLSGAMFALGGGIQHFISPTLAFDAGVELGLGSFNHLDDDGDQRPFQVNGSTSVRLRVGMTWHP